MSKFVEIWACNECPFSQPTGQTCYNGALNKPINNLPAKGFHPDCPLEDRSKFNLVEVKNV